jgi:hypothetical protein
MIEPVWIDDLVMDEAPCAARWQLARREAGASATARPQALGQSPKRAEDEAAEAASKSREDHREDYSKKGGLSSLCSVVKSGASIDNCPVIDAVDQRGASSSLPPLILPAPSD